MELQLLQQILNKLDKLESGQQKLESKIDKLEADNATIKKDMALIPQIWQAVLELSQADKGMQEKIQKHEAILDVLSTKKLG